MPGTLDLRTHKEEEREKRKKRRRNSDGLNTIDEHSVQLALHARIPTGVHVCTVSFGPLTLYNLPTYMYLQPPPHRNSRFTVPGQTWSTVISSERRHEAAVCASVCACRQQRGAASISMRRVENRFSSQTLTRSVVGPCFFCLSLNFSHYRSLAVHIESAVALSGWNKKNQPRTSTWLRPSQNLSTPKELSKLITQVFQLFRHPIGARNFLEITVAG